MTARTGVSDEATPGPAGQDDRLLRAGHRGSGRAGRGRGARVRAAGAGVPGRPGQAGAAHRQRRRQHGHAAECQAQASPGGADVAVPGTTPQRDAAPLKPLVLLLDPDGRVVASSNPARYQVGGRLGDPGMGALPAQITTQPPTAWGKRSGLTPALTRNGAVLWAVAPVLDLGQGTSPPRKPLATRDLLGLIYVQVPAAAKLAGEPSWWSALGPQLGVGLLVLVAAVPVGLVFGLLSTRRLIGRLRRLAATTVAVAQGDYHQRLPVAGGDEVAQLEGNFNRMAERLDAAMAAESQLAGAGERARIARELHDAISQDLFSLRLLAGGLRKALPADSPLHPKVETMERTATATMRS